MSTQTRAEQDAYARDRRTWFPLVSDADLRLTTALRLPTRRRDGALRLQHATLVVDDRRIVRGTVFPVGDVDTAADEALALVASIVR